MSKKRPFFRAFRDDEEEVEDCEPEMSRKKSSDKDQMTKSLKQGKEEKKNSFFGVFMNKDLQSESEEEENDERAGNFKFKKDSRESIKNHFTVAEKKKKPSPMKNVKKDHFDSSSDDEKEVIGKPIKKFSFSDKEEQNSPKKRISKENTSDKFLASLSVDSPRKTLSKNRKSIVKMVSLSKSYGAVGEVKSPRKSSQSQFRREESKSQPKGHEENSKSKKTRSKKNKDKGLAKIDSHFKPISIDDLLELPTREIVGDTGLTMDEILDKVDEEIREQKLKDKANMKILDQTIEKQREKSRALQQRMAENAVLRDKLTEGLTRPALKDLFEKNLPYLEGIKEGSIESPRHDDFHKGPSTRQALLYKMITHPFTDDQLAWVLEEMSKVWMRDMREQVDWTYEEFKSRWMPTTKEFHQINDYIWKVLLPECFIKFYMDFFQLTKVEAETKIKETPLRDDDDD